MSVATTSRDIREECNDIAEMLCEKNAAYGDSALDPLRVFSKADPVEQILVRIDDKLSRLKRGQAAGEDVERDLIGYLILLRIARKRQAQREHAERVAIYIADPNKSQRIEAP